MNFGAILSKTDLRDSKVIPKINCTNVTECILDDLPPVKHQGQVCSCVAHAASSIMEYFTLSEIDVHIPLSAGFLYGMQGEVFNRKIPAMCLRDVCKIMQRYGDCTQKSVPFNVEMPLCYAKLKPLLTDDLYKEAQAFRIESYARCKTDNAIKNALIFGSPVLMAVKWYRDYTVDSDGVICFNKKADSGLHAVMVYGFNQTGWLCQNSYGTSWGKDGRFILPYECTYREAWAFTDADNNSEYIHTPKRTPLLDTLYKALNAVINTAAKFFI